MIEVANIDGETRQNFRLRVLACTQDTADSILWRFSGGLRKNGEPKLPRVKRQRRSLK